MALINCNRLGKSYGAQDIFGGVTAEVPRGAKIALVGANGVGKTTLLRLLADLEEPSEGTVSRAKGLRIGFLPQESERALTGESTLWEEMLAAFSDLLAQQSRLQEQEASIASNADVELLESYGKQQEAFELAGGYTYETRIRQVLSGLGFDVSDHARPLSQLSGGQKTRALLARLLLENPDLLILDEPTNHLDLGALEWLEKWLRSWEGALLLVSHDRYFMDRVVNVVWELAFTRLEVYRGNYTHYTQQRQERHTRLLAEYETQQAYIAQTEDYIRRNIAGQNTRQAQGRRKRLERFKRDQALDAPREQHTIHLDMQAEVRSGDQVLITHDLQVGYHDDGVPLFAVPDITLYRGECAALIGPNGAGKTTFLKTILAELMPLSGESRLGASVQVGYFAQAHEALDPSRSVIDEILSVQDMPQGEARNLLARYLFTGDEAFKPVGALSGGERGRVALAKLALGGSNFLLLDEPTNHLDIPSQEVLEATLAGFEGTILLVSHDRYLIRELATQIWALDDGQMVVFEGGYDAYLAHQKRAEEVGSQASAFSHSSQVEGVSPRSGLTTYQRTKRIEELEIAIEDLEAKLEALNVNLTEASAAGDVSRVAGLGAEYSQAEEQLTAHLSEWEALQAEG
jgi:ATP-binding cassette subfamily F protein 3